MKKIILALAVMGMAAAGASTANAGVRFSFGIPTPFVAVRAPVVCAPVVCAPAPQVVYAQPAPVVVYSAPRYYAPRVYCPPAPVVRFGFDFGHYHPAYRHGW